VSREPQGLQAQASAQRSRERREQASGQRLWERREQASEQRAPQGLPLAPQVQVSQALPELWSWRARPDLDADRAGDPDARCRPGGWAARYRLGAWAAPRRSGEGHLRQAAAGPGPGALPAELPALAELQEPACSEGSRPQAMAAGDARARWQGDHGSVHAPGRPGGLDARASPRKAECARREPAAAPGAREWPELCRRAARVARQAGPSRGADAELPRSRLRGSRAAHRERHAPPGLRRVAGADRVPPRPRGRHRRPARPACALERPAGAPAPDVRHGVHRRPVGPAVLGERLAGVLPRHSVRPGRRQWASRLPAGGPTRSPAAASEEGRCSQETGGRVSWFSIHH